MQLYKEENNQSFGPSKWLISRFTEEALKNKQTKKLTEIRNLIQLKDLLYEQLRASYIKYRQFTTDE